MNTVLTPPSSEAVNAQNAVALLLSIVLPGLGHVYKGHVAAGLLWMFLGMPIAFWAGILLSLATAGFGLVLPLMCWAGLAFDAYFEENRRHHWLPKSETIYDDFD